MASEKAEELVSDLMDACCYDGGGELSSCEVDPQQDRKKLIAYIELLESLCGAEYETTELTARLSNGK